MPAAYVNFDSEWISDGWCVNAWILDPYGNVVWQYTPWYFEPQPVQNGSFVMRATGLYTVKVQLATWLVNQPHWTPNLGYNITVIYP